MSRHVLTSFTAHGHEVMFNILRGRRGEYGDWNPTLRANTRGIPGSDNSVTQVSGFAPVQLALRLEFDDPRAYRTFLALWGEVGTLTLLAGFTSLDGPVRTINGREYEQYHDTMLLDITDIVNEVDGTKECVATFQRAFTRPVLS